MGSCHVSPFYVILRKNSAFIYIWFLMYIEWSSYAYTCIGITITNRFQQLLVIISSAILTVVVASNRFRWSGSFWKKLSSLSPSVLHIIRLRERHFISSPLGLNTGKPTPNDMYTDKDEKPINIFRLLLDCNTPIKSNESPLHIKIILYQNCTLFCWAYIGKNLQHLYSEQRVNFNIRSESKLQSPLYILIHMNNFNYSLEVLISPCLGLTTVY